MAAFLVMVVQPTLGKAVLPWHGGVPAVWITWATTGVVMSLSVTGQLCQNIVAVPFLWLLPLAVYLLTFSIGFAAPGFYRRSWSVAASLLFPLCEETDAGMLGVGGCSWVCPAVGWPHVWQYRRQGVTPPGGGRVQKFRYQTVDR